MDLKQRIFWIFLFCGMFGVTCYFLKYLWFDTLNNPLVVSMESATYPITLIDFPAIALCNVNRISKKAVKTYAREIYPTLIKNNVSLQGVEWLSLQLGRLLDFSFNDVIRDHPFLSKFNLNMNKLTDWMKMLSPECDKMLVRCIWAGELVDCKHLFNVRRTARGHCCTFNYILDFDVTGKPNGTISKVKRQIEQGIINGLNIILDPMLEDYAHLIHNIQGFDVFVFDPTQYPDPNSGILLERFAEPNRAVFLELKSVKQIAATERKCLFRDERKAEFGDMYSYSTCIVNCRLKSIQSLCACTPFYYPTDKYENSICTLEHLRCLNKYKEKFIYLYPFDVTSADGLETELQDSLYCPDCLPDCEFTRHVIKSIKIPLTSEGLVYPVGKEFTDYFTDDINMTNKCFLSIYQSTSDGVLDRLDVVFYWYELLSNIGGVGGMLLGFSLINIVEWFYFFTFRFFQLL